MGHLHRLAGAANMNVTPNPRIAIYYAAGALLLLSLALRIGHWLLFALWPAFSLALVASAYLGLGPQIYLKRNGRLHWLTWLALWPVLVGQHLSLRHYARRCAPWNVLTPRVWIGRALDDALARRAIAQGVTAVLDLTCEFSEVPAFRNATYRSIPILDLTSPTVDQLDRAVDFIREQSSCGIVYVHCKIGYSRTAAVAGAYLLSSALADNVEHAIQLLRAARPTLIIRPEAQAALVAYDAGRRSLSPLSKECSAAK